MKEEKPFKCGKKFHNLKAVTGHKRIHSLRYKKNGGVKGEFCNSFDDLEQQEAAANAALTLMMLRGNSREFGSGQSSMDLGKNKSRKTFKCAVCFKEFGSGNALGGHMRAHYYKCSVCLEAFMSGEDLEDHKRADCCVQKGSRVYICSICFREFGSGTALGGHMRAHYRKCLVCSKAFEPGEDLEDHKRADCCVKKGSTVYKCSICFREFGSRKTLGGHTRVHNKVVTEQQGSYTLDLLQEMQAGRSFSGSYDSPSDTSSGAQEILLQHENKF
ncbi:zinc finger protein 271 [Tanacetum coccineum]